MAFDPLYPSVHYTDTHLNKEEILWKLAQDKYLKLGELLQLIPAGNRIALTMILNDNAETFSDARGSSYNHQAWTGGYLDHVVETMNIAAQLYQNLNALRKLPFEMHDALTVMFLHDLEKPWKHVKNPKVKLETKEQRREFRDEMIRKYAVLMSDAMWNAITYVEGIPDSKYSNKERVMGELAAFCHCCDILSARLWHDKGRDQEWE